MKKEENIAKEWYPIRVEVEKDGEKLTASLPEKILMRTERPSYLRYESETSKFAVNYYDTKEAAERVCAALNGAKFKTERTRTNETQDAVTVLINGATIVSFLDHAENPRPDSDFVLGVIWKNSYDYYRFGHRAAKALGISKEEWLSDYGPTVKE